VDSVVEGVLLQAEQLSVRDALQRLNDAQRQSIVMAYFEGNTTAEIAADTGVNRSTIKTRIRDGLLKLAADLRPL
jgi:RNA polymerase sigma-70 factor (ECF subfamily)